MSSWRLQAFIVRFAQPLNNNPGGSHAGQLHELHHAARRLLQSDRPSRRVVAAPTRAGRCPHQHPALYRDRPDRRARQVRHDLSGGQRGDARSAHGRAQPLRAVRCPPGAADAAVGARERDGSYRPGGDGIDDLQRALSRRPQIRLARPHQQRPSRLELRHVGAAGGSAQLRTRRDRSASGALRPRARIHAGRDRTLGQLGRRRVRARYRERAVLRSSQAACAASPGRVLLGRRAAQRAAPAAGLAGDRAGRRLR